MGLADILGFIDMLNEMRFGKMSQQSIAAFKALSREVKWDDKIGPTELFPRREDVERSNKNRMSNLNGDGYTYTANDVGGVITDPTQRDKMLANFMAPPYITVKEDAQVMLIKNIDETLVNGSMGSVIGFCYRPLYETDISGIWIDPEVKLQMMDEEDRNKQEKANVAIVGKMVPGAKPFPVVRFKVPGGVRDMIIETEVFKTELPNGEVQVQRQQVSQIPRLPLAHDDKLTLAATDHPRLGNVYT